MPDRIWLFDTVVLSNFLLAAASDILKRRYAGRASITGGAIESIISAF